MSVQTDFDWRQYPETQRWLEQLVQTAVDSSPFLRDLSSRMRAETGTQLGDWIDHLCLGRNRCSEEELVGNGFLREPDDEVLESWAHGGGMFPRIRLGETNELQVALKVDSVADFLFAHRLNSTIDGALGAPLRVAVVARDHDVTVSVIERHGDRGFASMIGLTDPANRESSLNESLTPKHVSDHQIAEASACLEAFRLRQRDFDSDEAGFDELERIARMACDCVGTDWACSIFFAAEREYWQSRNQAAKLQAERQQTLGLGWANHDHHTYRSSREHFRRLIEVLELLGMTCRERFYGGAEAGWGAQVLEQSAAGIVVFADVDLSPTEVTGDFAHEGLSAQDSLGTVGLWCKLHGEAVLQAGMHHLECQFDFVSARDQLADQGIASMKPFTDFDHLKQSFTEGERWAVSERRISQAVDQGWITTDQATRFRSEGSIGSHLEVLQRWNGYKGFNQTGISDIIRKTDPRHQT